MRKTSKRFLIVTLLLCILAGSVCPAAASTVPEFGPTGETFGMSRVSTNSYGYIGKRPIRFSFKVHGGTTPYFAEYQIKLGGEVVAQKRIFVIDDANVEYKPTQRGTYQFSVTVTDADDRELHGSASIEVTGDPKRIEYPETWEATLQDVQLTGDMKSDVIAVAKSQLGYTADQSSFRIDGNGKHFYSRYGEWYGAPYSEWCVMFISFCLNYANVPKEAVSQEGGCVGLIDYLKSNDAFRAPNSGYIPEKADFILMDYQGKGIPTHAGIVEKTEDGTVYTVEGNTSKGVAEKTYSLSDPQIIGFGSFQALLDRAGL